MTGDKFSMLKLSYIVRTFSQLALRIYKWYIIKMYSKWPKKVSVKDGN